MLIHKIIFWGLCATLIFVPLPFGLVEEWAIFIFEVVVFLLFALYVVERRSSRMTNEKIKGIQRLRFPLLLKVLLVVFLGITVLQLIPLPQFLLKILSPQTFKIYNEIFSAGMKELGSEIWRPLSFSPNLSLYELMKYICYFLFGYLVFKCIRNKKEIEILVLIMIASAVFQSFYGLIESFGGTERIFAYKKELSVGYASGTYINSNHFSGFLEMIFPISLCYLLAKANFFAMEKGLSIKERVLWFSQERLQKSIVFGAISVIVGIGIFLSRSRSGIFIFFITFFLMIIILSVGGGKETEKLSRKKRFVRILRFVFLVILFSVVMVGIRPIIERFSWDSLSRQSRPIIFKNTMDLIENYPLFGTGPGTYVYAYPMVEKVNIRGIVDHAHNDYLEFLAESGLIGGGSLILFAFWTVGYMFVKWGRRRDYFVKGVGLGCIMGIMAILVHSMTDFNLHIPANVVYFVALYALGIKTVKIDHRPQTIDHRL